MTQAVNENTLLCFQPVSGCWETVTLLGAGTFQKRIETIQFTSSLTQEECCPDFMLLLKRIV